MLYNYSITPLSENEFEKRAEDIVNQVKSGAVSMPLFKMGMVPEGNPIWDKAGKAVKLYGRYRDRLAKDGVEAGILIQASLGHGYPISHANFQLYEGISDADGTIANHYCPMDKNFLAYFSDVFKTLSKEKPKAIMLDDDFRMLIRPGNGCACPLHMAEFNRRTGLNMTRNELWDHISSHPANDSLTRTFVETQRDSLVEAARVFRAAIDEIDPTIQGINCTSGFFCEAVDYTNKVFAGKGNPTIVRVPNGCYAPHSIREFSDGLVKAAICNSRLKKRGIDIVLAETDTIPFNRYGKSARYLNSHYISSILEGLKGAKHWITRTSAFEPNSGKAYREILAKYNGMHEKLADIADSIKWAGLSATFIEQNDIKPGKLWGYHVHNIIKKNLERMGIPFYLSENSEKVNFIEGKVAKVLTDEKIKELFENSVFADGEAAKTLTERGYGEYLGVEVTDWDLGKASNETFDGTIYQTCTKQKNHKKLTPINSETQALSHISLNEDGKAKLLAPAVTSFSRGDKLSVVFCGSPTFEFNYKEGFAFLNESRKAQIVELLRLAGALPVYCVGDDEICFKAGFLPDGKMIACVYLLGIDPVEGLNLFIEKAPESITVMQPDGSEKSVEFSACGDGVYNLNLRVETLEPAILFIKFNK